MTSVICLNFGTEAVQFLMLLQALLRPGRLDRIVYVPLPDEETRYDIFEILFRKMPVAADVDIKELVSRTEKYSGAEVRGICSPKTHNFLFLVLKFV